MICRVEQENIELKKRLAEYEEKERERIEEIRKRLTEQKDS